MNKDEINDIARYLTQQWTNLIRSRTKTNLHSKPFLEQLESNSRVVLRHEDETLLEKALDIIPLQKLYEEAEIILEERDEKGSLEDHVVQRLLHWFKTDFFTWVDNAPCDNCQNTQTKSVGTTQPNEVELSYGAGMVERYLCLDCNTITRFPRYNDPGKLLETRRGRCGEWANCFTLCCRAVGSEARIVYDTSDHVWTEVYSEYEQRWIHCDSCEEAWDKPLLYSVGWNKKLNYCTAFSAYEALDVTKRYTRNWVDVLNRRNLIEESELALFLDRMTVKRQQHFDQPKRDELSARRLKELIQLNEDVKKVITEDANLPGRQSGALIWRTSRGETSLITENYMADLEQNNALKKYPIFIQNNESQLALLGTAHMQCDSKSFITGDPIIRLTKAVSDQRGAVYCKQTVDLDDLEGIEIEFAFRITDEKGLPASGGADGFAFIIQAQSERELGGGGCELGYGGIKNSMAVEFDTYQSLDRCDDPSSNHISIQARLPPLENSAHHRYSLGHTSRIPLLANGKWMKSKIRLLSNGSIEIGLGESNDQNYIQVLKIQNQNFKKYLNGSKKAWIGFTASTGGISENHDVQLISILEYRAS
ncbi:uncharacterized protein EV154DRAFT_514343 [Mucor mucedo]|uniref:uncharacterized protein n=1 Tax=Mucor mucedo TaxID=29922 RepID=UPI0022201F56|nr:uncharacterized protein EV154DRAFT_514343 [Mucor mucedo]KAI7889474.1 hypothetical protein EV154DRAFT_514343 [Mucor mucedo]